MTGELRLPAWANELRNRYLSGESSLFVLHGNVRDIHPWDEGNGKVEYLDLRRFLERFLARTRDIVAYYNVSQGLCFTDRVHERRFQTMIDAKRMLEGAEKLVSLPRTPAAAIPLIEELITTSTQSSGVILDYFEMVCPNGDVSFMSSEDRANLVAMQRWASEPAFVGTDNIAIIVTQSLSDVARRVVSSPQMSSVLVPYPDQESRLRFLEAQNLSQVRLELPLDQLAKVSAGLTLTQLQQLLRSAAQGGEPITFRAVAVRKKAIIEQECHGLVEFVAPDHDFSHVGGMEGVKGVLMRVADAVKKGHRNRVPMGMIFVGPMGTGKTFIAEAFAGESGLTCLQFKNFREKWVGSTEGNLEKILDLVEALGYVLLIIDEADRSLSAGESDGGTSSRVIARLKEFMSDTSHRGRVVILMMTNRPDKLDTDLKRPGRFDLKIPFFFPEEAAQRESVLRAQVRKNKLLIAEGVDFAHTVGVTEGYSAAELEAVLLAAGNRAAIAERDQITQEDLDGAANDVVPSRDTRMLEYMEMLAVFESSSREMLPARYRHLSTDDVHAQLDLLRSVLGRRAEI
jgi:AAA+ superfamily predicted ATPase